MLPDDTRRKIENITKGIVIQGIPDNCTAVRNLLCAGFATSTTVKTDFEGKSIIKKEQTKLLEAYATENNLWIADIPQFFEVFPLVTTPLAQAVSRIKEMIISLKISW